MRRWVEKSRGMDSRQRCLQADRSDLLAVCTACQPHPCDGLKRWRMRRAIWSLAEKDIAVEKQLLLLSELAPLGSDATRSVKTRMSCVGVAPLRPRRIPWKLFVASSSIPSAESS